MDELHVLVRAQNPSIVFIVESWISEDIQDCEISIEDYHIVRLDRNRHGGGIIIYIHVSLNWEVLLRGPNNLEFIALSISPVFSNVKHCVSVLYLPPSSPVSFFDDFCNTLQHLSPHLFTSFMVVGDFNIIFFLKNTPNFCKLNGILQTISLSQVVHTATHTDCNGRASLIDLALVSRKTQLVNCSVIPPLANSDHNGLEFLFKWKPSEKQVRTTPRVIWRYKEADYGKACQMIDETNWDDLLCNDDVNCSATNWHNKFMEIISSCIPRKSLRRKRNVPWLTQNIIQLIRKHNTAFRAAKKYGKPEEYSKYKKLRNIAVKMIKNAKKSYFEHLDSKDKKRFLESCEVLDQTTIHHPNTPSSRHHS